MKIQSLEEMNKFGESLASGMTIGQSLLLKGELGVGKTALARAIIRAWIGRPEMEVPSPSFTLIQSYEKQGETLNHIDLYRLGSADELIELGVPEIFDETISIIEWPERLGELKPKNAISIEIFDEGGDARLIKMERNHA